MVEGELHAVLFRRLHHAFGLAKGRRHGLLAVDGLHLASAAAMTIGACSAGQWRCDDVEVRLGQHLVVVEIDGLAPCSSLECLGILPADVGQRTISASGEASYPWRASATCRCPWRRRPARTPAANDSDPILAHRISLPRYGTWCGRAERAGHWRIVASGQAA